MNENIVKFIRKSANLSQAALAEQAGVSTLFVIRAEQLLHTNLSRKLASALSEITHEDTGLSADAIREMYVEQRARHISEFSDQLTSAVDYDSVTARALMYAVEHYVPVKEILPVSERSAKHPFTLFRTYLFDHYGLPLSQIKFCIYTGLHPAILSALENRETTIADNDSIEDVLVNVLRVSDDTLLMLKRVCDDSI